MSTNFAQQCQQRTDAASAKDGRADDQMRSASVLAVDEGAGRSGASAAEKPPLGRTDAVGPSGGDPSFGAGMSKNRGTAHKPNPRLLYVSKELGLMASRMHLPSNVVDTAVGRFKRSQEKKTLRGHSIDAIVSAILYTACKQENVPHTLNEICAVSKVNEKKIRNVLKSIRRDFDTVGGDPVKAEVYMSRFCSNLGLPYVVLKAASHIVKLVDNNDNMPDCLPKSLAAAAIFMALQATQEKRTLKEIGVVAGVTTKTVQRVYKSILDASIVLFPKNFESNF